MMLVGELFELLEPLDRDPVLMVHVLKSVANVECGNIRSV